MKSTLRIFALTVALCLVVGAWVKGARDGYRAGAQEVGASAYAAGLSYGSVEGFRLATSRHLEQCMPWSSWRDYRVVVCKEQK